MNASNLRKIIITHNTAQKSFFCQLERLAQQLIGEQYEAVYDFFRDVLERKSTYKILSARRCQVLFELFCPIILLSDEVRINGAFLSSNALERHLDELRCKDASILIVDDVLIHGRGIKRLYELFDPDYSRSNIEVAVFCCAINAACVDEQLGNRILKGYFTAFDYEWRETSCRFVDFIESSAIPYESFAGGLASFSGPALSMDDDRFISIANSTRSRIFFEKREPPPFLKEISYDMCLRTYTNDQLGAFFFVPYVFLKNIKTSRCVDLFDFVTRQLEQEHCSHIIGELLASGEESTVYRMRLFSSLVNRIYGLHLTHVYGVMEDACPTYVSMELCFGHEVARELASLSWQDISGLLELTPLYEEGSIQEDDELSRCLMLPDSYEDDAVYRFLSMYYYINGVLDELTVEKHEPRRVGLTMEHFYRTANPGLRHELTAAQIRCWDLGQASGIMRSCGVEDCIAMYGVAGEQNFRFILQENRDYFRKRNKEYALGFSGLKDGSSVAVPPLDDSVRDGAGAFSHFDALNRALLKQFLRDNEDRLEEWYIPQFIS